MNKLRVVELFAGVGGFRLGMEGWKGKSATSGYKNKLNSSYEIVWSNQWEPSTKTQNASLIYKQRWPDSNHVNKNINEVDLNEIPNHDVLVGGFPCQDYSVAKSKNKSAGLAGDKGALWWAIHNILSKKKNKPKFLILENVDRLLISPSSQRGRDFSVILKSLDEIGYAVEWRVVNAADYGMPQRRKRVFILGYKRNSSVYKKLKNNKPVDWLLKNGVLAKSFPVKQSYELEFLESLSGSISEVSKKFNIENKINIFQNSGVMINGLVYSAKLKPNFNGDKKVLNDVIQNETIPKDYFIQDKDINKWIYLKGSKKEFKVNKSGHKYLYAEGAISFPDLLDRPSRTIITGEGGASPSRFKHVIRTENGLRRLTAVEFERLNMMPDKHTCIEGVSEIKRVYLMGNALVVGLVEKISKTLANFEK